MHKAVLKEEDNVIFVAFRTWRTLTGTPSAVTPEQMQFESYVEKQKRMQEERNKDNNRVFNSYRITTKKRKDNASTTPPVKPSL